MNIRLNLSLSALLSLCLLIPQSLLAAPKVVVTIAPIHSLVTGLMEGIGEPVLLNESVDDRQQALTDTQLLHLITADMIVWVGAGYERSLADQVAKALPGIDRNMYALSNHLPLLTKRGIDLDQVENPLDRQANSDLGFWMDPKLATIAVRRMAIKLALLDPDNSDRYLDNEIKVVNRIKAMGKELAELLMPVQGAYPDATDAPTYLAWRYRLHDRLGDGLQTAAAASPQCHFMMHASLGGDQQDAEDMLGARLTPGADLYFDLMKQTAEALVGCANGNRLASRS